MITNNNSPSITILFSYSCINNGIKVDDVDVVDGNDLDDKEDGIIRINITINNWYDFCLTIVVCRIELMSCCCCCCCCCGMQ